MKTVKICFITLVLIILIVLGCREEETDPVISRQEPFIAVHGNILDSIYLYTSYNDQGANVNEGSRNMHCEMDLFLATSGTVNTRIPGTYFLTYTAEDASGKTLSPVTRTVHVVENPVGYLNGVYDVACTCTAVSSGSSPTVSITNYSATVFPENARNQFRLIPVLIGHEYVGPNTYLYGDSIDGGYWSADYQSTSLSGRLSPSKNSFTMHSVAYLYSPAIKYTCNSVYTKQLVLNGEEK